MFYLQLLTSFLVGGLLIASLSLIGERVPLKWRKIVLTVPTTIAIGFFFIGLTKTPADVTEASVIVPAALIPDYLFVLVFALLSKRNIFLNLVCSYAAWALSAKILLQFPPSSFAESFYLYFLPFVFLLYWLIGLLPQEHQLKPVPFNIKHVAIRSLVGGSILVVVVYLAQTLGNIWGGLFSAFPGSFSAILLIFHHVHGAKVIPAVSKSLFFPGAIGFSLYAWIAGLTFPLYGIWIGTLLSYLATFVFYWLYQKLHLTKEPPSLPREEI